MSSPLAIASVTYVLKDLLNNGIIDGDITAGVGKVEISALPPDRIETGGAAESTRLNLFMYMATPNPGWRNQNYPAFNSRGDRIDNPYLALDLHYLLIAYGRHDLHLEVLLGYGMQILNEHPILRSQDILRSLGNNANVSPGTPPVDLPPFLRSLSASGLAEQPESIKITPETLNTEEISRLWTAFGAKYRPFAAYMATVVLIENRKPLRPTPLPVREPMLYVQPLQQPHIERIQPVASEESPQKILSGEQLAIIGRNLLGEITFVNIGSERVEHEKFVSATPSQITLTVPGALLAGIHGAQVIHEIMMGKPPQPHKGFSSNVEAFVLSPKVVAVSAEGTPSAVSISIELKPAVGESQQVVLLLNHISETGHRTYRFTEWEMEPENEEDAIAEDGDESSSGNEEGTNEIVNTSLLKFSVTDVPSGKYLVRVQVDGAESPVSQNEEGASYNMPFVEIPASSND